MRKLASILVLLCAVASASFASITPAAIKAAHKTTHVIQMGDLLSEDQEGGHCSGTAIGPHALLTATHCVTIFPLLTVDGKTATVVSIMSDSLDHSIYLLDGVTFENYAEVDLSNKLEQGEEIFIFGHPAGFLDMFRKGVVAGYQPHVLSTMFDINTYFGDSGSGLFDENGKVVAVNSCVVGQGRHGTSVTIKMASSFDLRLTKEQLEIARTFQPPVHAATKAVHSSLADLLDRLGAELPKP